jgi:hypothetical protein
MRRSSYLPAEAFARILEARFKPNDGFAEAFGKMQLEFTRQIVHAQVCSAYF